MNSSLSPAADALLSRCRQLLEGDLGDLVEDLGPVLVEEVGALVESTRDLARKAEYQRLLDDLQQRWSVVVDASNEELQLRLEPTRRKPSEATAPREFASLQLVSDEELAEQIVMREFIGRVSEACSEELYALDRRIAHLSGLPESAPPTHRLNPDTVCHALKAGCAAMYEEAAPFTLLLRQVERHLRDELPPLFRAINEILIEADILPSLKRHYRPAAAAAGGSAAPGGEAQVMGAIQRLARKRGGGEVAGAAAVTAAGAAGGSLPAGMVAVDAALVETLKALPAEATSPQALTNLVRLARESSAAQQFQPLEAITLDIVAMLFDLVFADEKIAATIKGLIGRLQIPILKMAMRDQHFFADRSHPARRFLDSISGIANRWGNQVDEGDPFYLKLSALVDRIQAGFDQDPEVFTAAIRELSEFVTQCESREAETSRVLAEVVQRQEAEALAQRERLAKAREASEAAVAVLIEPNVPPVIEGFLRGPWCEVLQHCAIAEESAGERFNTATRVARELIWSIAPKKDAETRQRHVALLPKLVGALNQGLDQIGATAESRHSFMDALVELQLAAMRGEKTKPRKAMLTATAEQAAPASEVPPVAELRIKRSVEQGVRIETVSLAGGVADAIQASAKRAGLRRVKQLVRGDWVEFIDGESVRRERLTWISPNRSLFLFSNSVSKCAISITPEALAHRLNAETARLVERDAPMFERALEGAIKALDSEV